MQGVSNLYKITTAGHNISHVLNGDAAEKWYETLRINMTLCYQAGRIALSSLESKKNNNNLDKTNHFVILCYMYSNSQNLMIIMSS
jgi:hypothetical protein